MEVKIKDGNGCVDADWTIEDGVMVVSPKGKNLKWKPNLKERYYCPILGSVTFDIQSHWWADDDIDRKFLGKGWVFSTEKECKAFCNRLNEAINQVKP